MSAPHKEKMRGKLSLRTVHTCSSEYLEVPDLFVEGFEPGSFKISYNQSLLSLKIAKMDSTSFPDIDKNQAVATYSYKSGRFYSKYHEKETQLCIKSVNSPLLDEMPFDQ